MFSGARSIGASEGAPVRLPIFFPGLDGAETHSLEHPCSFVNLISNRNRFEVRERPAGYHWCDFCLPARRDG